MKRRILFLVLNLLLIIILLYLQNAYSFLPEYVLYIIIFISFLQIRHIYNSSLVK